MTAAEFAARFSPPERGLRIGVSPLPGTVRYMADSHSSRSDSRPSPLPVLGVSGHFGSGKDAVAAAVAERLTPSRWAHVSFARELRVEANRLYVFCDAGHPRPAYGYELDSREVVVPDIVEFPRPMLDSGLAAPLVAAAPVACGECGSFTASPVDTFVRSPETRRILLWHGTQVRRAEDEDYWVKLAMLAASEEAEDADLVVFTDVRFPNEAKAISNHGGVVVRLEISDDVRDERLLARDGHLPPEGASQHASETSLDSYEGFDLVVSNDGPFDPVVDQVAEFVAAHLRLSAAA